MDLECHIVTKMRLMCDKVSYKMSQLEEPADQRTWLGLWDESRAANAIVSLPFFASGNLTYLGGCHLVYTLYLDSWLDVEGIKEGIFALWIWIKAMLFLCHDLHQRFYWFALVWAATSSLGKRKCTVLLTLPSKYWQLSIIIRLHEVVEMQSMPNM